MTVSKTLDIARSSVPFLFISSMALPGLCLLLLCLGEFLVSSKGADPRRCCGFEQVLTFEENSYCCRSTRLFETAPELSHKSLNKSDKGFLEDLKGRIVKSIPLKSGWNHPRFRNFCYGVLIGEKTGDEANFWRGPVLLYYSEEPDEEKRVSLLNIKRCCEQREFFDVKSRGCIGSSQEARINGSLGSLILRNEKIGHDFVYSVRGEVICDENEVLVEQEVDPSDIGFTPDGQLQLQENGKSFSFEENKACLEIGNSNGGVLVTRTCRSAVEYCEVNYCLRKCCPEGEWRKESNRLCSSSRNLTITEWHKAIIDLPDVDENGSEIEIFKSNDYGVLVGLPCSSGVWQLPLEDTWFIESTGMINVSAYEKTYSYLNSCIDSWINKSYDAPPELRVSSCSPLPELKVTSRLAIDVFMWISCAFLLATLLVYVNLPELQNLHGKTVMAQVGSLLMAYAFFNTLNTKTIHDSKACRFFGYSGYFFFICTFIWLSLFCFDIWWTLGSISRSSRSKSTSHRRKEERKRFHIYCLVAFGSSFFLTIFALLSDELKLLPKYLRPGVGKKSCWFAVTPWPTDDDPMPYGAILFFIGPVSLLLLINLVFYILTAWRCSAIKTKLANAQGKDDSEAKNRRFESERIILALNAKLFVVMGVSWVFEMASSLVAFYGVDKDWLKPIFLFGDMFNALRGVMIFAIFILKRRVFKLLSNRCGRSGTNRAINGYIHDPFRARRSTVTSNSTVCSSTATNP